MKKPEMKKISKKESRLRNRIFSRNGDISFGMGRDTFRLVFSPTERPYTQGIGLMFGLGESRFMVGMEKAFSMNLMDGFPEGERLIDLPGEIRDAVLEACLEELLDRFNAWSRRAVTLLEADFDSPVEDSGYHLFFELIRQEDLRTFVGRISLDGEGLEWLSGMFGEVPPVRTRQWNDLPVKACLEIGRTALTLGDFGKLEKNDIVFLDECPFRDEKKVIVRLSPTLALKASLKKTTVIVQGIMEDSMPDDVQVEENMDKEQEETPEADRPQEIEASSIDEINIDLVFELGRKTIPVGDLKTIGPGYTFDLDNDLERPVTIRANGKIIGLGELLQVDDRVGVRVLDLFER